MYMESSELILQTESDNIASRYASMQHIVPHLDDLPKYEESAQDSLMLDPSNMFERPKISELISRSESYNNDSR